MVKPSTSNLLDNLVDLACRDGVDVRPTLLRVLTDLYIQKPIHSAEEETQFVELVLGLIDAVNSQTRAAVTATLQAYPAAPAAVLRKLADTPSGLGPRGEPEMHELIELFFSARSEERRLILINLDVASGPAIPRPMPAASELIRRLENAALQGNKGEFSRVLERALGISRELADRITRDNSGEAVVVAAKALGIKAEVLQRILLFLNPDIGQSTQRAYELSRLFDELDPGSAEHMLTIWRTTVRRHSVHESVYWNDERHGPLSASKPALPRVAGERNGTSRFKTSER